MCSFQQGVPNVQYCMLYDIQVLKNNGSFSNGLHRSKSNCVDCVSTKLITAPSSDLKLHLQNNTHKAPLSSKPSLEVYHKLVSIISNYWMRLSMIARIIKAEVCVICRSRRLRRITQTEALIISLSCENRIQ